MFTIISIERLQRLVDLVNNWDGPISAGIGIKDASKELPQIMNTWLNTPRMRKNVDIHLLFNDEVKIAINTLSFN